MLLVLYGISWAATYTSRYEKILDSFKWYCIADYEGWTSVRSAKLEAEFYREKYRERLDSLTAGLFDYRDKTQVQEFFLSNGLLYEEWQEEAWRSYLLAEIVSKGNHRAIMPEEVNFNYFILGEKKVMPFLEFKRGDYARPFVSHGEDTVYIHRDSLDYILREVFNDLWDSEIQSPGDFHRDELTYCLYRDLQTICEDIFIKRIYRHKKNAEKCFIEKGIDFYLPAMLAMGARLALDRNSKFELSVRDQRALLTGLALEPSHTMLYLVCQNPSLRKLRSELAKRLDFGNYYLGHPDRITLEQISRAARDIFEKMEASSGHKKE